MTNKILLAIDPGASKPHAYALFKDEKLVDYGLIRNCEELNYLVMTRQPEMAVIEDQHIAKNMRAGLKLAQAAGGLAELLKYMDVRVRLIPAREWTKAFMRWRKGWPPRKAYLPAVVKITQLSEDINLEKYTKAQTEDICCAVQIGRYWLRRAD